MKKVKEQVYTIKEVGDILDKYVVSSSDRLRIRLKRKQTAVQQPMPYAEAKI